MIAAKKKLFKDRINKTNNVSLAKELIHAIEEGGDTLTEFLLGTTQPELYSAHGTYKEGNHQRCGGLNGNSFTEKRLCKCLYYKNGEYCDSEECQKCDFADEYRRSVIGDYFIADYEVPAFYYGDGVGEIDMVISDGKTQYATEVKPPRGNKETLLRMIAEIMTYTIGYPAGKYERAIAFFEGTSQAEEFENPAPEITELLQKGGITAFCFKEADGKAYQICRL